MNKIALIGNGYWGSKLQKYIPEYFDLKYIADSEFDKNTIWEDKEVTSVIIATPIETHYEITKEALKNNKHVLVEKPVALKYEEAIELKEIANEKNLKIGVEYTQTFSPSINHMMSLLQRIGDIEYIEMSTKHLGRFIEYDVYWLLASHHLSILDMLYDLNDLDFVFTDHLYYKSLCTTGSITFKNKHVVGRIDVSLNYPGKEMSINLYGENGTLQYNPLSKWPLILTIYDKRRKVLTDRLITDQSEYGYDEKNNLRYAIGYFNELINGNGDSNIDTAIKITRILEDKDEFEEYKE